MRSNIIGKIAKITGSNILVRVSEYSKVSQLDVVGFTTGYISVGSLVGAKLVDGRTLVMTVEEIYDSDNGVYITASISGVFDDVTEKFSFGTNKYPLIGAGVYRLEHRILSHIFEPKGNAQIPPTIGTYIYNPDVTVGYNPNVLFGKHLGVFGNTGSGKTCTVVSVIQRYIRQNPNKDIKFVILDVNGEYRSAFEESEAEYISFANLRFHHSILSNPEYGRLFRAAEGVQYPALKECIGILKAGNEKWDLRKLSAEIEQWIDRNTYNDRNGHKDNISKNQLNNYLRTMNLRIDGIVEDDSLMNVINATDGKDTVEAIFPANNEKATNNKKVIILDLQVSSDSLDIVVYLLFKAIYEHKSGRTDNTHLTLVLEEAHRYINTDAEESKLGSYYIDKISREGRKFGIGLMIASQVPSMLSYAIVSQCNSVIMHKITSKRDMEFLRGVLRISNDTFYLQMSALEKQHAIVCGEAFPNDSIVRICDAKPLPRSSDPEINDIPFTLRVHQDDLEDNKVSDITDLDVPNVTDEWDELIDRLQNSMNFATTHSLIGKLARHHDWTLFQTKELCRAVLINNQVEWILEDDDVNKFYRELLSDVDVEKMPDNPIRAVYGMLFDV
ncbi:MAG: ATP-binding protein [Oscillibacter sp.]|nr:ATP-binding protein [Oscillibacter sp.]